MRGAYLFLSINCPSFTLIYIVMFIIRVVFNLPSLYLSFERWGFGVLGRS